MTTTNIKDPEKFSLKLNELLSNLHELFELSRELDITPDVSLGKTCYEVSNQFTRPHDFFVTLLDVIRVAYEPTFFETYFLNANWGFLLQEMPTSPFRLGYLTAISEPNERFTDFFVRRIKTQMREYNYSLESANAVFAIISFREGLFTMAFMDEVNEILGSGFSVDDALGSIAGELNGERHQKSGHSYSGFSIDNSLDEKLRLSIWFFLPPLQ